MRNLKTEKGGHLIHEGSSRIYLDKIEKIKRLNEGEEITLGIKIKQGDKNALHKLITANLLFVVSVAQKYQHSGLSLPDLIQEGSYGLIKAALSFDETKGFKFISYAVKWIRIYILLALNKGARIRIPENNLKLIGEMKEVINLFLHEHQYEPIPEDLFDLLKATPERIKRVYFHYHAKWSSLDESLRGTESNDEMGNGVTLLEKIKNITESSPEEKTIRNRVVSHVREVIHSLNKVQQDVLCSYYGIQKQPEEIEEIARRLGITKIQVDSILYRARKKLKRSSGAPLLRQEYLELCA